MSIEYLPLYFLHIKAKLSWGFACRLIPFGKSRMTMKAPPPSTLLGALAYPLARSLGWPEVLLGDGKETSGADRVREFVVSAHARLNFSLTVKADINRVFWFDFQRKEVKTDAIALERIYTSPISGARESEIELLYIVRPELAERALGGKWASLLEAGGWSLIRVGQKEGLVSAEDVRLAEAEVLNGEKVKTSFYFPLEACSSPPKGSWIQEFFIDPWEVGIGEYTGARRLPFVIPYSVQRGEPAEVEAQLEAERGVAILCGEYTIISLRRWLGL